MKARTILTTILLMLGILTSCETVHYITPTLPDYGVEVPERPILKPIDEEVPEVVTDNLRDVLFYAEKLEVIIDGWEGFYAGLQEIYSNERTVD